MPDGSARGRQGEGRPNRWQPYPSDSLSLLILLFFVSRLARHARARGPRTAEPGSYYTNDAQGPKPKLHRHEEAAAQRAAPVALLAGRTHEEDAGHADESERDHSLTRREKSLPRTREEATRLSSTPLGAHARLALRCLVLAVDTAGAIPSVVHLGAG
jgi:hypothetical protein